MAKAKTVYFVVKWKDDDMWDVLNVEDMLKHNRIMKRNVLENPDKFIGQELDINWSDGKPLATGLLLAHGKFSDMEAKRTEIANSNLRRLSDDRPSISISTETAGISKNERKRVKEDQQTLLMQQVLNTSSSELNSDSLTKPLSPMPCKCNKYQTLKKKYKLLKRENSSNLEKVERMKEGKTLLSELRTLVESAREIISSNENTFQSSVTAGNVSALDDTISTSSSPTSRPKNSDDAQNVMVSIGNLVNVSKGILSMMLRTSTGPTVLARSLLMHLFTTEDLIGKSLTGRQSNAHKGKAPKPGLDKIKLEAIIGYTMKRYPTATKREIMDSLSNKVKEINTKYMVT